MLTAPQLQTLLANGRTVATATAGDDALGVFKQLPGSWANLPDLPGRGWNMIALPFRQKGAEFRLLLNQYNETLTFDLLDTGVRNRGAAVTTDFDADQTLVALQYVQHIKQLVSVDAPPGPSSSTDNSHAASDGTQAIHHEPGILLHLANQADGGVDLARLATIPHGDAVLALGLSTDPSVQAGPPDVADVNLFDLFFAMPVGAGEVDPKVNGYLAPYRQFQPLVLPNGVVQNNKFQGLFDPTRPLDLLIQAASGFNIAETTVFQFNTSLATGGISNIPFVSRQANPTSMVSRFWVHRLVELDAAGQPQFVLQYAQKVMLEFVHRFDGNPGLIQWPHISINTMKKVSGPVAV